METLFEEFYNYMLAEITGNKFNKIKFTIGDVFKLKTLHNQFLFLIKYENDQFTNVESELKDSFKNGKVLYKTYHDGTKSFKEILEKFPQLKKISNCETIEIETDVDDLSKEYRVFYYEDRILYDYTVIKLIDKCEKNPLKGYLQFKEYQLLKKSNMFKMTDNGLLITKEQFNQIFNGEPKELYIRQNGGNIEVIESEKITKNNYFKDKFYKLFDENGEILDTKNINYSSLTRDIRNAVAHNKIENYYLADGQEVTVIQLDKKVLILENKLFDEFLTVNLTSKASTFNYMYVPKLLKPAVTENELNEVLNKSNIIKITLDEYGADSFAFDNFLEEIISNYANEKNIKISIEDYLQKHISKYYENFKIEFKPVSNKEGIIKRIITYTEAFNDSTMSQEELTNIERIYIMHIINSFYPHFKSLVNTDYVTCKNSANVFGSLFNKFWDLCNKRKIKLDFGVGIEKMFTLCQFTIFFKLIKNSLFDNLKQISSNYIYDTKNFSNENLSLINNIQNLDMSKIEIIDLKTKKSHRVESFGDKLFSLRLIRNSLSHNAVSYKLQNLKMYYDMILNFKSLENDNLTLKVKAGDLLNILSNDFFKLTNEVEIENKFYLREDFENLIKNLCK